MRFQLIGVNHNSAPVEMRERLAIPESSLPDACRDLAAHPGIEEGIVISTCNRVEFVTHTTNGAANLRGFLREHFRVQTRELEPHLYEYREEDAVRHVFRVASSLDSMVVGEAQILGQVKEAYATARAVGAVRAQLEQLFVRAFAVAKRVRTETAVGSASVSIASVAVELAKKIFGTLQGKTVFIVGAGKMSELAACHLMAHGCAAIFVSNRTYEPSAPKQSSRARSKTLKPVSNPDCTHSTSSQPLSRCKIISKPFVRRRLIAYAAVSVRFRPSRNLPSKL